MKPNILFIMTDQQAPDMMSCTGTSWLDTPALDGLAAEGTRFEQAVCASPLCVPSRMSMATGRMPSSIGASDNKTSKQVVLDDGVAKSSLGLLMQRAGYDTFYGGKVHMCPQLKPPEAGYDVCHSDNRATLADKCIQFISEERAKPFFAVASFVNPHDICFAHNAKVNRSPQLDSVTQLYQQAVALPDTALPPLPNNYAVPDHEPPGMARRQVYDAITPTGTMSDSYDERDWRIYRWVYARVMEQVDQHIGRILNAIKTNGLEEDTLILFTSDHGNMHGNHRLASKSVFYEESVRVPFLVKRKGYIPAGHVNQTHLVSTGLDILPTFCEYADIEVPAGLPGISLRDAAELRPSPRTHTYVFSELPTGRMLRDARWKYTKYKTNEPSEILTDLEADPGEMTNLAVDPASSARLDECRTIMNDWFESLGETAGSRPRRPSRRPGRG